MFISRYSFTYPIFLIIFSSYFLSFFKVNTLDNLLIILILLVVIFYPKPVSFVWLHYHQIFLLYLLLYFSLSLVFLFISPNDFNLINYIANLKIFLFFVSYILASRSYCTKVDLTHGYFSPT